ncbi:E3 ubiquitin-protein ligase BRE1 [Daldinia vernicosa]|uniref:E3 ubiquitin-protein ligase BRE1 n=1 Tax=Daldinia vernicosa TaxID=114800 RepID=UPI0020089CDD|nr:E3 ubiquitin-protein ligase BRE1 [Daldinia vernicosa]KAI0847838.1 E3 ubiquitin-protein ligase BRE1 [Daldinia vernicosa]
MPLSTSPTTAPLSTRIKMEDRKRPAMSSADDMAPPSKRQAVNGGSKSKDDTDAKDEAWIEDYQKDAIYRQMLEYKREKNTLETQLGEVKKRSAHHDDHIRIVDNWWIQLLQEIELLVEGNVPFQQGSDSQPFPTHTQFKDLEEFESHLSEKTSTIKKMVEAILGRLNGTRGKVAPDITDLEKKVNALLSQQKEFLVKLDRLSADKESLSEQLNIATLRYMKAERRLDRAKSAQVQKLEQQALNHVSTRSVGVDQENGVSSDESNTNSEALQLALREAKAVAERQKEQLESALAQNKSLQEELTSVQTRLTNLTDEDYSRTEVFKVFKSQMEDLLRKVNSLEADNKSLRAAAEKLEAERESNRRKVESEAQALIAELEDQLQQADTTLARVRSARDELHADVTMLRASKEQDKTALEHMKELVSAEEDRIATLESELQRLQPSEDVDMTQRPEIDALSLEELREKYKKLLKDYNSIESELPGMTHAVKRFQALAHKKVMDQAAMEERVALAIAEKSKADQKYFTARKDGDLKFEAIQKLRTQNSKSTEIISQLKEVEAHNRTLVTNLDKQLADLKQTNASVMAENRKLETSSTEMSRRFDALKQQVTELANLAKSKDSTTAVAKERAATLETDVEKLKVRLESVSKDRDKWKVKCLSNSSEEEEMLRSMATCSICKKDFKNTVLRTCGHIFCRGCIDDRISNRMRKCPACSKAFDKSDAMTVHL